MRLSEYLYNLRCRRPTTTWWNDISMINGVVNSNFGSAPLPSGVSVQPPMSMSMPANRQKIPADISQVKPLIRQSHQLYSDDLERLKTISPELITSLARNRLVITLPNDALRTISVDEWMEKYNIWLDENIHGFYTMNSFQPTNFILSFEIEAELVQFAMSLK